MDFVFIIIDYFESMVYLLYIYPNNSWDDSSFSKY